MLNALYRLALAVLISCPGIAVTAQIEESGEGHRIDEPIEYILKALQEQPVVCLAEGGHQAKEPHLLLRSIVGDKAILTSVDVIIVEFASATHQAVLDAYIRGEDIPFAKLSRIWRDTGQSPRAPWDSPLYFELLNVIRSANVALPPKDRVRVIAGDPPIDWARIRTREEYRSSRIPRDPFVAELAMEQAFKLGRKVLIIFGGAHLPKVPLGPDDPRNSLTHRILTRHPGTVTAVGFLDPETLGVEDRIPELIRGKVYPTANHWSGDINAERFFKEIYSLVTDPQTGQQSWQEVPLYTGHTVRALFDALVYLGPSSEWEYVPASFDEVRDAEYLRELDRRSRVRFNRPLRHGQD